MVPLLCHCSVLWLGEGDGQLLGSGRGAIARCHCSVLWWGQGVVPLQGAIVVCYGLGEGDDQLWGSGRGAIVPGGG